jgi:hypothetical protein
MSHVPEACSLLPDLLALLPTDHCESYGVVVGGASGGLLVKLGHNVRQCNTVGDAI